MYYISGRYKTSHFTWYFFRPVYIIIQISYGSDLKAKSSFLEVEQVMSDLMHSVVMIRYLTIKPRTRMQLHAYTWWYYHHYFLILNTHDYTNIIPCLSHLIVLWTHCCWWPCDNNTKLIIYTIIYTIIFPGYLVCLLSIRHAPETHPTIRTAITSTPHTAGTTPATSTCVPTCIHIDM